MPAGRRWAPPRTIRWRASRPEFASSARQAPTSTPRGSARRARTAATAPAMYAPRFGYSVAHAVAPLKQPLMPPLMHSGSGPVGVARASPCVAIRCHQCERVRRCEVAELHAGVRRWEVQDAGVWYLQRPHVRSMRGLRGRTHEVQLSGVDLKRGPSDMTCSPHLYALICTYMDADVRVDGVRCGHGRQLQHLHGRAAGPRRSVQHVPPRHPPAGTLWLPL